jgi:hypothetical protein
MFPIDVDDWWFLVEIGSSSLIGARGSVRKKQNRGGVFLSQQRLSRPKKEIPQKLFLYILKGFKPLILSSVSSPFKFNLT